MHMGQYCDGLFYILNTNIAYDMSLLKNSQNSMMQKMNKNASNSPLFCANSVSIVPGQARHCFAAF